MEHDKIFLALTLKNEHKFIRWLTEQCSFREMKILEGFSLISFVILIHLQWHYTSVTTGSAGFDIP